MADRETSKKTTTQSQVPAPSEPPHSQGRAVGNADAKDRHRSAATKTLPPLAPVKLPLDAAASEKAPDEDLFRHATTPEAIPRPQRKSDKPAAGDTATTLPKLDKLPEEARPAGRARLASMPPSAEDMGDSGWSGTASPTHSSSAQEDADATPAPAAATPALTTASRSPSLHDLSPPPSPPDAPPRPSLKPSVPPPERAVNDTNHEANDGGYKSLPPLKSPPRPSAPSPASDTLLEVLGLALLGGIPYYLVVWRDWLAEFSLATKLLTSAGSVAAVALLVILTRARSNRLYKVISQTLVVGTLAAGAATVAVLFSEPTQGQLLRLFSVLWLSLLPPWLYLLFVATRGRTFWDDYVLNLFRMHADDFPNLPVPPTRSVFFHYRELSSRPRRGPNAATVDRAPRAVSVYEKKYTALFGPVPDNQTDGFSILHGENLWPVALATLVFSVGWVVVLRPENAVGLALFPTTPNLSLAIPLDSLRFAFMGAYAYTLQVLVRRYFQNDLKTGAYVHALLRVVVVMLVVWALEAVLPESVAAGHRAGLAFLIGVFPEVGWRLVLALLKWPAQLLLPSLKNKSPLSDLDGLNLWYEARLREEGIDDLQNLATANLVDVMLNTRIPVSRLIDWVDQALLYLRVSDEKPSSGERRESDRAKLRRYGIRCATDLCDALGSKPDESPLAPLLDRPGESAHVLLSVRKSILSEPNLHHTKAWKEHAATYLGDAPRA